MQIFLAFAKLGHFPKGTKKNRKRCLFWIKKVRPSAPDKQCDSTNHAEVFYRPHPFTFILIASIPSRYQCGDAHYRHVDPKYWL